MKSIGFARTGGADLFEDDTQVYHRALRTEYLARCDAKWQEYR